MKLKTPDDVTMTAARTAAATVRMIAAETSLAVAVAEVVAATLATGVQEAPGLQQLATRRCSTQVSLTFLCMSM